jgi:hypothetical protein
MKKILVTAICAASLNLVSFNALSQDGKVQTVKSPAHRVALLELYTSEGCSSCPPADRFLSKLKTSDLSKLSDKQSSPKLIPMAFHVTYWDYIGWKDKYANKQYDQRQRDIAHKNKKNTVYTPQFVLAGDDYRRYKTFNRDIKNIASEKATVDIELSAEIISESSGEDKTNSEQLRIGLTSDITKADEKEVNVYVAVIENNLFSEVADGENEGERLQHDYVVRTLLGPYLHSDSKRQKKSAQTITLDPEWKTQDLSIVGFAENPRTGEVLQAVRLKL